MNGTAISTISNLSRLIAEPGSDLWIQPLKRSLPRIRKRRAKPLTAMGAYSIHTPGTGQKVNLPIRGWGWQLISTRPFAPRLPGGTFLLAQAARVGF